MLYLFCCISSLMFKNIASTQKAVQKIEIGFDLFFQTYAIFQLIVSDHFDL